MVRLMHAYKAQDIIEECFSCQTSGGIEQKKSGREPERERIVIPAWWSVVALIMAGLVFLPIQYAKMYGNKVAPQEGAGYRRGAEAGC